MRNNFYSVFLFLAACFGFAACSNENTADLEDDSKGELITVSLAPTGNASQQTRGASTSDVYGINVWYDANKDGVCEKRYAYGLFDNKDDMKIQLISSYKYKFECTLVKDATNKLYCGSGNLMAYPFQTSSSSTAYVENKFNYGESPYLSGIGSGKAHLNSVTQNQLPNYWTSPAPIDRYFGVADGYKPTAGGRVTIEMKRTVFGVKFIVTGVTEGSVRVSSGFGWSTTSRDEFETEEMIYCYDDVYNCWLNEPDLEYNIDMSYTSDRGSLWNYSKTKKIAFKRNVMTTVRINVEPDLSMGNFTITEEALESDNNIEIGLDPNGLIDIIVDPNEEQ